MCLNSLCDCGVSFEHEMFNVDTKPVSCDVCSFCLLWWRFISFAPYCVLLRNVRDELEEVFFHKNCVCVSVFVCLWVLCCENILLTKVYEMMGPCRWFIDLWPMCHKSHSFSFDAVSNCFAPLLPSLFLIIIKKWKSWRKRSWALFFSDKFEIYM